VASLGAHIAGHATGQPLSLKDMVNEYAPKYGVDPWAAPQVSNVEGGGRFGAVGDQGTSFGPWQLHIGGAMPAQYTNAADAGAFANSAAGVEYVMQQMGKVSSGLKGRAAVEAIVRRFERPADPTGEVARAMGSTGTPGASFVPAGGSAPVGGAPFGGSGMSANPFGYRMGTGGYQMTPFSAPQADPNAQALSQNLQNMMSAPTPQMPKVNFVAPRTPAPDATTPGADPAVAPTPGPFQQAMSQFQTSQQGAVDPAQATINATLGAQADQMQQQQAAAQLAQQTAANQQAQTSAPFGGFGGGVPFGAAAPANANGIVKTAMSQIGIPYQWGGAAKLGGRTDCSGLAQAVYGANGIQIPRTTYQQWSAGTPVAKNQLQQGDLVFFHMTQAGPGHVGIYIGNGKFVEDPHTGSAVRVQNLNGYGGFVGARRF